MSPDVNGRDEIFVELFKIVSTCLTNSPPCNNKSKQTFHSFMKMIVSHLAATNDTLNNKEKAIHGRLTSSEGSLVLREDNFEVFV